MIVSDVISLPCSGCEGVLKHATSEAASNSKSCAHVVMGQQVDGMHPVHLSVKSWGTRGAQPPSLATSYNWTQVWCLPGGQAKFTPSCPTQWAGQ